MLSAAAALIGLVLLAGLPPWPKVYSVLNDAAHAPAFGALALILLSLLKAPTAGRSAWTLGGAWVLAVALGVAVEWIQGMTGRESSWKDVGTDALGAACALGLAGWWREAGYERPIRLAGLVIAVAAGLAVLYPIAEAAAAYRHRATQFPVLAQFDSPLDLYFASPRDTTTFREPLPDRWRAPTDTVSLRLRFNDGTYPGLAFTEPARNWRGRSMLMLDVTNPDPRPLELTIRVHDLRHNQRYDDRFNRAFTIAAATRATLTIPIREIERGPETRSLDLESVAGIIVFSSGEEAGVDRDFYLTRIWLE